MSAHSAAPFRRSCSLAAALVLVACGPDAARGPLAPGAPALSAGTVSVPFRGRQQTFTTSVTPLGPTTVRALSAGTGTATHLGRFTIVSDAAIDFGTFTGLVQSTLTAANGDVLYATVTTKASPNPDGVTLNVVETATITGGTGRFAGATGSYIVQCVVNKATGSATGVFDGTITLDT